MQLSKYEQKKVHDHRQDYTEERYTITISRGELEGTILVVLGFILIGMLLGWQKNLWASILLAIVFLIAQAYYLREINN